jgi:hypothetical protein
VSVENIEIRPLVTVSILNLSVRPLTHLKLVAAATESIMRVIVSSHRVQRLFDVKQPISYRSEMASVSRSLPSNIATADGFRAVLIRKHVSVIGISDWNVRKMASSHSFKELCS